ncbi:MAG: arginase [Planctomycetes bacterium]|nr:arginase [Planctomycetota bacterium]
MQTRPIQLLGVQAGTGGRVPGAQDGPWVLRERGLVERLAAFGHAVEDLGDIPGVYETTGAVGPAGGLNNLRVILQCNRHTHACVLGSMRRRPQAFMLIVGGDHSLAIGTLAGLADSCGRLGLIWIDAHADFNTPATSPSGNIHGMSLAVACGNGHRDLRHIAGRDPMVREDDVFLFGVRDVDPDERENLRGSGVNVSGLSEWRRAGFAAAVSAACEQLEQRCDHIHLSFDIDALDAKFVPATGTPVADGLTPEEAMEVLATIGRRGRIASAEFVEYNPILDADGQTGELTVRLIESLMRP